MPFLIAAEEKHKKIDVSFIFDFVGKDSGEEKGGRERACISLEGYTECMPTFLSLSRFFLLPIDQRSNLELFFVKLDSAYPVFEIKLKARINSQFHFSIFFQSHPFDSLFPPTIVLSSSLSL